MKWPKRLVAALVVGLLALPSASAETLVVETFEDYAVGAVPTDWVGTGFFVSDVEAKSGAKSGRLQVTNGIIQPHIDTDIDMCAGNTFDTWFYLDLPNLGTDSTSFNVAFQRAAGETQYPTPLFLSVFGTGQVVGFKGSIGTSLLPAGTIPLQTWVHATYSVTCAATSTISVIFSNGASTTYTNSGGYTGTGAVAPSVGLGKGPAVAGTGTVYVDDMGGASADNFLGETPAEFDSGLLAFISGIGFVTPESQFFFAIILVGLTTISGAAALKFMAPGRMKLIIVSSLAMLVGVFCVLLSMFDLWMYVLAVVLGGTIIKGGGDVRSTWHEVRDRLANRSMTINVDTGAAIATAPAEPAATPTTTEGAD